MCAKNEAADRLLSLYAMASIINADTSHAGGHPPLPRQTLVDYLGVSPGTVSANARDARTAARARELLALLPALADLGAMMRGERRADAAESAQTDAASAHERERDPLPADAALALAEARAVAASGAFCGGDRRVSRAEQVRARRGAIAAHGGAGADGGEDVREA